MIQLILTLTLIINTGATTPWIPEPPEGPQVEHVTPRWATESWQNFAAHIVASEARNVPEADIVIACTLVRDVENGWNPWALRSRWFGWGNPDDQDRGAVLMSLSSPACDDVPKFRFVGNLNDVRYWRSIGMIPEGPYDLYVGRSGSVVVGVR